MWQSNRSRSTGWQSPALPPVRSASQPGENTSEQPSGKCGCWGTGVRCRPTTSSAAVVSRSMRAAFWLIGVRCFMPNLRWRTSAHAFGFGRLIVELAQVRRISFRELAIDAEAGVGPPADPLAIVQVRMARFAVPHVGLVIAAAGAERPRPARVAVGLVVDVVRLQEGLARRAVDPVVDRAEPVRVRPGEAVAERHVAVGRHAQKSEARAARERLAHAAMDLGERLLDVRKAVVPVLQRERKEFVGEIAELLEHQVVAVVRDRMLAIGGGGDRREADLPEPDLVPQVIENAANIHAGRREGDARAYRARPVTREKLTDLRLDHVVAAGAVVEHAELVLHFTRAVDRN